jgi:cytochrome c-type biogenesis protein CcmH
MRTLLLILLWLPSLSLLAAIDAYEFANDAERAQFTRVIDQLRCPKCQNQNIAGSDAPIAKDIRERVHALIQQGKSDAEIIHFMEARFGEFVNYKPSFRPGTWVLWLGPPLLMIGVAAWVWRKRQLQPVAPLTAEEQQRINQLLAQVPESQSISMTRPPIASTHLVPPSAQDKSA